MADKEVLELTKLEGSNYSMWNFGVRFLLQAKDLTGVVDGTEPEPDIETKPNDHKEFVRKSSQAAVILLSSVDRSLHPNLINCRTPKEIWDKLKVLYGDTSIDAKQNAWEQFYSFRMSQGESVAVQIERLESICRKLEDAGEKPSETAIISKLLSSLPSRFSVFRIAWDCTPEAERTKNNLIARLLKEDKRLSENEEDMSALALQVQRTYVGEASTKPSKKQRIQELKKRTKCAYCKEKGHWVRECSKKKRENKDSTNASAYVGDVATNFSNNFLDDSDVWIADSGASMHMTYQKEYFTHLENLPQPYSVRVADNKDLTATGKGTILIEETVNGRFIQRELRDVLLVPNLKRHLFSVGTISNKNYSFHVFKDKCEIRDRDGKLSSVGVRYKNLFRMCFKVKMPLECNAAQASTATLKLWHERMAHVNVRAVQQTCKEHNLLELDTKCDFFCEACIAGKQSRKPHATVSHPCVYGPGEKIHTDVCGPVNIESPRGTKYFLLFKDECTKFRKVYFLRHKSEVFEKFQEFEAFVLNQLNTNIKVLRSDNGKEYTSREFSNYLQRKGIVHEFSSPYIHEQNGKSEREIRTITELARSMLLAKNVDHKLWPEAISTACYVLNRIILQPSERISSYEKWFGRMPQVKHLKVFGSQAYLNMPKEKRHKFDPKSRKVIFVGYDGDSTNYRLWDNKTRKIYISSDVDFNENYDVTKQNTDSFSIDFNDVFGADEEPPTAQPQPLPIVSNEEPLAAQPQLQVSDEEEKGETEVNELRVLRNRESIREPDRYGVPVAYYTEVIPISYHQAMASENADKWKQAMDDEMAALQENHTWSLSPLPKSKRAIGCRWIFAIKSNSSGELTRYKARLVAKGFSQREGIDYFETYAPVVRYESVRLLLALAAERDYELMKFDVKTAFLYGQLQEEIYMEQPPGYCEDVNSVCKLHRSLYGLKQSPRCWNEKFVGFLKTFSFASCESDKCVFVGTVKGFSVYLALYVDDGLLMCENRSAITVVLEYLHSNFKITVDSACEFLGFQIIRNRELRSLKICQRLYVNKLLDKFNMQDAKFSSIPAEPGVYLSKDNNLLHSKNWDKNKIPYREAVGSLLFAARISRPDIEFSVNYASQFLECFGQEHWKFVQKILRYLKGTVDFGITFGDSGSPGNLLGFTDADYAGCLDTRKSRSGFVFMFNGAPISWSSQRQNVVSLSTAESEYIALSHGAKEAIWLRQFVKELNINCNSVRIFVDNQASIKLASNSEHHKRSKHIDVRYHFIRDIVNKKQIALEYVSSKDQLADIFTKPLAKAQFYYLREKLSIAGHSK